MILDYCDGFLVIVAFSHKSYVINSPRHEMYT